MDDTKRLLELVDELEGNYNDRYSNYTEAVSPENAESLRKALRKLEMLEQGARQIFLSSL